MTVVPEWARRFSLDGRRALVTGASKGIGAEIAAVFANSGADLALVARDAAGLEQTAGRVRDNGRQVLAITAEMSTLEGPVAAAQTTLDTWGQLTVPSTPPGVARIAPARERDLAARDETMAVMTPMGGAVRSAPEKQDPFIAATPARRLAEPVEIADMALYLASDAFVMVNGVLMMIDGGFTSV